MAGFLAGLGSAMKGIGGAAKKFGKSEWEKEKAGLAEKYGDSSKSKNGTAKKKKKLAEALAPESPSPTIPRMKSSD